VESGFNTEIDYHYELLGMQRALDLGVCIPKVSAAASIEDQYLFRYIMMDYINGIEAKKLLKGYSMEEKIALVHQLKGHIHRLNTPVGGDFPSLDVRERALVNPRCLWKDASMVSCSMSLGDIL